jgi:hypothetical protein
MRKAFLIYGLVFSWAAFSQTAALEIESVSVEHKVKVVNTGLKPITGYAVQDLVPGSEWNGWTASVFLTDPPMSPGASEETLSVGADVVSADQLKVVAVVFSDGTHSGHAHDILCGKDAVTCIFEKRQGMADGLATMAKQLAALPASTKTFPVPDTGGVMMAGAAPTAASANSKQAKVFLTKGLASQSVHDREMNATIQGLQNHLGTKNAAIQAGTATIRAVQQELLQKWQKGAQVWGDLAIDKGEAQ